jgi:hypothetical protein
MNLIFLARAGHEKENSDPQSGRHVHLAANAKLNVLPNAKDRQSISSIFQKSEKRSFGSFAPAVDRFKGNNSSLIAEPPTKKRALNFNSESKKNDVEHTARCSLQAERIAQPDIREREEQGIKNWLNFLLQDLQPSTESLHSISAFQTLQSLRVDQQRRSAVSSIAQSQLSAVWDNLDKEIRECRIVIRQDRNIFCDFGLKDKLLQIIFGFENIWLRPALEVIFNCTIPRSHNNDSVNLHKFLLNRLSKNHDVKVKVNSKSYDTYSSPQFCKEFNQFVLSSFLRLATLLDRCKNCKVIERNPCLFTKYGEIRFGSTWFKPLNFKSTKEAVTCFSKEFLSGEGDVIRHLTLLGVNLTFQQCALDEYEFNVSNLFSDLRDGVVLAKIVDIVNEQSDELSSKLRVPAISRLQKVR